jgi:hypothetical protein
LAKLYGGERNWFKVLGGFTIAMTIDRSIFKANLGRVLSHTPHSGCVEAITGIFLEVDLMRFRSARAGISSGRHS